MDAPSWPLAFGIDPVNVVGNTTAAHIHEETLESLWLNPELPDELMIRKKNRRTGIITHNTHERLIMTEDTALASGKGAVVRLIAVFMMGIDLVIQIQDGGGDCA